jgi:hypothetical protein
VGERVSNPLSTSIATVQAYLFLWSKVIHNVEELANLLGGLALDHVGNGLAAHIAERGHKLKCGVKSKDRKNTYRSCLISR